MPRGKRQPAVYLSHLEAERAAWEEERQRLTARIAELEAMLERCVRLVVETGTAPNNGTPPDYWVGRGKCYASDYEAEAAIRAALETPEPRP
jgi:hypothetical protein